ncbi:MAG: FkbM family methyltransferase [Pseudomonadota bacterium]
MRRSLRLESYEGKEAEAALRLIRRGDVVLELGGGIGFMSTLIATKTRAREVHSFEANPRLIEYIREVHSLNKAKKAQVHHAVLGEEDGSATFYLRQDILSSSLDRLSEEDEATEQTVPMRKSSTVFQNIEPTVLVCDIEGAESTLIPQLDLSGLRAVLIELHPQWIGRDGIRDVFAHLHQSGLVFFPRMSHGKVAVFRSDW